MSACRRPPAWQSSTASRARRSPGRPRTPRSLPYSGHDRAGKCPDLVRRGEGAGLQPWHRIHSGLPASRARSVDLARLRRRRYGKPGLRPPFPDGLVDPELPGQRRSEFSVQLADAAAASWRSSSLGIPHTLEFLADKSQSTRGRRQHYAVSVNRQDPASVEQEFVARIAVDAQLLLLAKVSLTEQCTGEMQSQVDAFVTSLDARHANPWLFIRPVTSKPRSPALPGTCPGRSPWARRSGR